MTRHHQSSGDDRIASAPGRDDIRFRILVPVWGQSYIDNFCDIALPALLAEGNLPALVRYAECEVIFLTTQWSEPFFASHPGIAALNRVCPHSFVFIDDLFVIDTYGFILTIAYGRGIASMGERQLSTYFVFLNADFVFSDGLLTTVVDRIERGFNAVLAPSLRCNEEEVTGILQARVDAETRRLSAKPADLVRITLEHLHPTAGASVVNGSEVRLTFGSRTSTKADSLTQIDMHHGAANQFFWRVDDDTLIARYFLMFMLCIRPERLYERPVGWCDYVFVPELVPSGRYDVLVDSDDGFILEMQRRVGDFEYLRVGRIGAADYAPRLSIWATAHHRDYASRTVALHAGPLPARFDAVKAEADTYMGEMFAALSPAVAHLDHAFWTGSLDGLRTRIGPTVELPDLGWTSLPPVAEAVVEALAEQPSEPPAMVVEPIVADAAGRRPRGLIARFAAAYRAGVSR